MSDIKNIIIITVLSALSFYISNAWFNGSMKSEQTLASELITPVEHIQAWKIKDRPPYQYRVLFPAIVLSAYNALHSLDYNISFFNVYYTFSLVFQIIATLGIYLLLKNAGFSKKWRLAGALIFIISPAVLFAYTVPIHTREDMLAYSLLTFGLIALLQKRHFLVVLFSCLGVLTRETLLILPLVYAIYASAPRRWKASALIISVSILAAVRLVAGIESYDIWLGLKWNLANLEQVVAFGFITFHFLWIPFLWALIKDKNDGDASPTTEFFHKSALLAFAAILTSTFIFGIFNEIRLLFLLFPWVLILALQFLKNHIDLKLSYLISGKFLLFSSIIIMLLVTAYSVLYPYIIQLVGPVKYNIPVDQWIIIMLCYAALFLMSLPVLLKLKIEKDEVALTR